MKKLLTLTLLVLTVLVFSGCDDDNCDTIVYQTDEVPTAPQGVYSITGNNAVYVYWNGLYDPDVYEYIVYRSDEPIENYSSIGSVDPYPRPSDNIYGFEDNTAGNGNTYYYAVRAVDSAGQASELSWEEVMDTPRPDGRVTLFSNYVEPDSAGFNFFYHIRTPDTSDICDVFVDSVGGVFYLNVGNYDYIYGKIQDVGNSFYFTEFIGYAPTDGWSDLGYVEILENHSYVIYTYDFHYALLTVRSFNVDGSVTFDWAYQTAPDNRELAPSPDGNDRRTARPSKKAVSSR
jgi:hypothetical protein